MKQFIIHLLAAVSASTAIAQTKIAGVVRFKSQTIDLGKVVQDKLITATFEITNISKSHW